MHPQAPPKTPIPGIRNIVAVGSGKGGVGKTTVAVNLALSLKNLGRRIGLLDSDVYGPNVPLMMNINRPPRASEDRIEPVENYGVKLMSMGFLNPGDKPLIWRGPMLHSAIQQFLRQVDWGELDYLIIDLPPGTGDVALSLAQTTPITGAIVVTTPSEVSLEDARKAVNMFYQVRIPMLGIVENMSGEIFGTGGGERTAEKMNIPFLGALSLDPQIRIGGDTGKPVSTRGMDDPHAAPFLELARKVEERCAASASGGPSITIEE